MHAIYYMHQTSGACADVYTCDLTHQMEKTESTAHLDLFFSPDPSICSLVAFSSLGNFDYVVVSVSFDFPSNSKGCVPFYCIHFERSSMKGYYY